MAISNNNTGLRPGVCTSSTRPTSPYSGQVIYETDTKQTLVYQGSSWVMLTDADAPPGLVLIKTQAVGTTVSSVTVTGVFSSEFDNYKITWNNGTFSAGNDGYLQLGSSTSSYAYQIHYANFGASSPLTYGATSDANFRYVTEGDTNVAGINAELIGPYLSKYTACYALGLGSGIASMHLFGLHKVASSYTDFTVGPNSGTMSGGTIRVYGYRTSI